MNWLVMGGPILALLGAMGVVLVVLFVLRQIEFRRAHVDYVDFLHGVENVLAHGNIDEALIICDETNAPVARVAAVAIRHRESDGASARDAVDRAGRAETSRLERRLTVFALMAQTAPLIGLLGTFGGLVRALLAMEANELVSRADLAGACAQALVAALAGLIVSIPAHVMYGILRTRIDRMTIDLDAAASDILAKRTSPIKGENQND